ncbi:MAG: PAS domain-containing sensor histidine kinase [Micavibrio aeruginosavorus]|uniref:histidine kinase n=1 Tax=Micavibrio aeruginosavorus TaxID=349221 RepID=A0A2W5N7B9_9BACT|nr:MAG: PAS domain-containing sensor histidine kinase [Micavibrio aeruginosavorus]
MNLDHADFIARHTPGQPDPNSARIRARRIALSFALIIVYIIGCVILAMVLNIDETMMMAAGAAFVLAAFLAFLFQRFLHNYSAQEKERALLQQVIEGSRGARLITDATDHPVFTNQRFDELCEEQGAPGLETLARLFSNNEEAHNHFRGLAEQAQKGLPDSIELKSVQGDRERWFIVSAQPVAGWAGYVHWRVDDVTHQREIDRTIREEREKLIDFTDNAPVGFFSVDEGGHFVFANATLARWLGEDLQTLLNGGSLHAFMENAPKNGAAYDITDKGGTRQVAEVQMKGVAGRTFLASVNQTVVFEDDGRVRTRGVMHDLTAEREMRQALQASEDRFQKFFEEAPLGVALVDAAGVLKDCNAELAHMLASPVDALEGKNLKTLLADENRERALSALAQIGQGEQLPEPIELILKGKNPVSVQMHARRIKGTEDIVLHFIDLTEQKRLEMQFVQSQKMQAIGQLAGGIAHDFNNLLTAIIGFCDLLLLRHKPSDSSFGDIMQIKQNSNRAANLVRQLLAFSRQQTLRPKVQDVTDILTEVSHLLRRLIGANIELDLNHGLDLGLVKVDVGQMEQVLINLAVNARDAMEKGGKLSILTHNHITTESQKCCDDEMPPGQWVAIAVKDTGCGISPENLSRILEPFFTTKDVGQGTGLGLATVYGIIRQTGGYLSIDSSVGIGTTFTIYLPRLSEAEAKLEQQAQKPQEEVATDLTGTARILLVEDEDAVRSFSTRALTNKGYQVLGAESGEAALTLLETQDIKNIDLLITDVMMPGMDGPTMAKKIREMSPELKIIFISGYTEDRLKDHMGDNIFFLPKPFTLKQLAEKVKEALG